MINDSISKQEGGDNSSNYQARTITNNYGISYQDAKSIANDVFKANYLELSEKAASTARQRAEELIDDFLTTLQERSPQAISSMEEPGMQHAVFTAQKEYAKTGDKDLSDMLVDILVDRAAQQERNLKQIVLDESLTTVPKLTSSQLDTLTIIFLLKYSINHKINNIGTFKSYLETQIQPFIAGLSKNISLYQHLEFAGCGSITMGSSQIEKIYLTDYKGIFCKGFTREQLEVQSIRIEDFPTLILPCLHDRTKFQVNAINDEVFETQVRDAGITQSNKQLLKNSFDSNLMDDREAKEFIKAQGDFMEVLFDVWDDSSLKNMTLTSVGIAIATANLRRKAGISVDLGIWIK